MLTIQKFADLAGTTKRTLNFYDEKNLFMPKKVLDNGYRYYDYDQLYDLTFILELRRLGLSISEIKLLQERSDGDSLNDNLKDIMAQINNQLDNLTILKETLNTRFNQTDNDEPIIKNRPFTDKCKSAQFCRSKQSVSCTEEEIAEIYADFYEQLGKIKLVNKQDSGFLTQLPNSNANLYHTASFCILKEVSARTDTGDLPIIEKSAGDYISINTTNDTKNICISLQILDEYIKKNHIKINDNLWQMNLDEKFTSKGASNLVCLQYKIQ